VNLTKCYLVAASIILRPGLPSSRSRFMRAHPRASDSCRCHRSTEHSSSVSVRGEHQTPDGGEDARMGSGHVGQKHTNTVGNAGCPHLAGAHRGDVLALVIADVDKYIVQVPARVHSQFRGTPPGRRPQELHPPSLRPQILRCERETRSCTAADAQDCLTCRPAAAASPAWSSGTRQTCGAQTCTSRQPAALICWMAPCARRVRTQEACKLWLPRHAARP